MDSGAPVLAMSTDPPTPPQAQLNRTPETSFTEELALVRATLLVARHLRRAEAAPARLVSGFAVLTPPELQAFPDIGLEVHLSRNRVFEHSAFERH